MKKYSILFALFCGMLFALCGCNTVTNAHLTSQDFADHLVRSGIKVESIQPIRADIFSAFEGLAIRVAGQEIGVYKYNLDISGQKSRLGRIEKEGCAYVLGIKYPVVVCGAFMLIGVDKNPQKRAIIEALHSF